MLQKQWKNRDIYLGNIWAKLPRVDDMQGSIGWKRYFARV
jgi:hypothetical protein